MPSRVALAKNRNGRFHLVWKQVDSARDGRRKTPKGPGIQRCAPQQSQPAPGAHDSNPGRGSDRAWPIERQQERPAVNGALDADQPERATVGELRFVQDCPSLTANEDRFARHPVILVAFAHGPRETQVECRRLRSARSPS